MKIGIPKEIKDNEARVSLVPASAAKVVRHGHEAYVEAGAGLPIGFSDAEYLRS
jgi:alanine dehydrogenase